MLFIDDDLCFVPALVEPLLGGIILFDKRILILLHLRQTVKVTVSNQFLHLLIHPVDLQQHLFQLHRSIGSGESGFGSSLIDQVDRLIRQIAVIDISGGKLHRRLHSGRGDHHLMVFLVFSLDALQNSDRLLLGRFLHRHRLESSLQRRVLLDVFAVFGDGGGSDQLNLPSGQGGL